jgi:hypothetical protein
VEQKFDGQAVAQSPPVQLMLHEHAPPEQVPWPEQVPPPGQA